MSETSEQVKMEAPEPQEEHRWLQRMVGEWLSQPQDHNMGDPDKLDYHKPWIESVRTIGGLWIVSEGRGDIPDIGESCTMMTVGYSPRTRRFLGSLIGSMMTHFWVYDGALDKASDTLVLYADGPDMASKDGAMAKYRDSLRFIDDNTRELKSEMQTKDGSWTEFMTVLYRRTK